MKTLFFAFAFLYIFILTGCADDPIAPPEDHFEAIGMVIYQSRSQVASILKGQTTDTLYSTVDSVTDSFTVKFYDEDEDIVDPPFDEDDIEFSYALDDTSVAQIILDPVHKYEFKIKGKSAGTTKVEFFLLHSGHADFKSGKIPLKVNP